MTLPLRADLRSVYGDPMDLLYRDRVPRRGLAITHDGVVYDDGRMIGSFQCLEVIVDASGVCTRVIYLPVELILGGAA